jgi:hypothetical protein
LIAGLRILFFILDFIVIDGVAVDVIVVIVVIAAAVVSSDRAAVALLIGLQVQLQP